MSKSQKITIDQAKEHIRRYRYDRLKIEKKKNPDYREIAKRLLPNSPSQEKDKLQPYKELDEIQLAARMILELGHFISVPTDVSNCACVHLYAFYKVNSIAEYERNYVAVACLFMACKTEDHPRAVNDIVIAAYNHWFKRSCKETIQKRKQLEQKLHELKSALTLSSGTLGPHSSPSNCDTESVSPRSIKSPGSASASCNVGTPNSDFKSPGSSGTYSLHSATTPQPTTPDESGTFISCGVSPRSPRDALNYYNRHNLYGSVNQQIQKLKSEIKRTQDELKRIPLVRYLNPNNKKECVIPPDNFFHETKPKIEAYESDLLCSIGFSTIVSLPHILIVEAKSRFVKNYGESVKPKIERIVYIAYDLATRVVSLFPVQQPRDNIAAALIYLCGPFNHPVEGKEWWRDVYGANMTEHELIELSELICDAWIATKDYYTQIHCKGQSARKPEASPRAGAGAHGRLTPGQSPRGQSPSPIGLTTSDPGFQLQPSNVLSNPTKSSHLQNPNQVQPTQPHSQGRYNSSQLTSGFSSTQNLSRVSNERQYHLAGLNSSGSLSAPNTSQIRPSKGMASPGSLSGSSLGCSPMFSPDSAGINSSMNTPSPLSTDSYYSDHITQYKSSSFPNRPGPKATSKHYRPNQSHSLPPEGNCPNDNPSPKCPKVPARDPKTLPQYSTQAGGQLVKPPATKNINTLQGLLSSNLQPVLHGVLNRKRKHSVGND